MKVGDKIYCIESLLVEGEMSQSLSEGSFYEIEKIEDGQIQITNDMFLKHYFSTYWFDKAYYGQWFKTEYDIDDIIKRRNGRYSYRITDKMVDDRGYHFLMVNCQESGKKYWVWDGEINEKWVYVGPYKDPFEILMNMPKFKFT